jgi:hypothetical protein
MLLILIAGIDLFFLQIYETLPFPSLQELPKKIRHPIFSDSIVDIILPRWMGR